jgi:hypothetical protein
VTHHELPPNKHQLLQKAVRLEWLTIAYLLSAVAVLYVTLGNSQAMKAAWAEDILSLLPPIAFLIAARVRRRSPTRSGEMARSAVRLAAKPCSSQPSVPPPSPHPACRATARLRRPYHAESTARPQRRGWRCTRSPHLRRSPGERPI